MPHCAVCQTRYTAHKTERCPQCGWDVQALSFVAGMIPEVAQKEAIRLEWAKQLWSKAKLCQDRSRQIQIQLEAAKDRENRLHSELAEVRDREQRLHSQISQQKAEFTEALQQREPLIAALKTELIQAPQICCEERQLERRLEPPSVNIQAPEILAPKPSNLLFFAPPRSSKPFYFESVVIRAEGRETTQHQASYFEQALDESIGLEMVTIPAGWFEMGSPEAECGRDIHESPQHRVSLPSFALSRFLITQAQWKAIAALPKIKRPLNLYPADFEGEDRPVEQISWYDAIEFCARLTYKTGHAYRLPSEAEWEYACRAGTTTPFHWGETIASDLANYDGNYTYGSGTPGLYRQGTTPMMSIANPFGLSDMHGNLWEWCADAWHDTYAGAPTDGSVWEAEEGTAYRVLRGGAWYCLPELCRSAQRHWNQPDLAGSGIGFRVVCAAA